MKNVSLNLLEKAFTFFSDIDNMHHTNSSSSVHFPFSNFNHPTSIFLYQTSIIQLLYNVKIPLSNFNHPTSIFPYQTIKPHLPLSNFNHPKSYTQRLNSTIHHANSHQPSNLHHPSNSDNPQQQHFLYIWQVRRREDNDPLGGQAPQTDQCQVLAVISWAGSWPAGRHWPHSVPGSAKEDRHHFWQPNNW